MGQAFQDAADEFIEALATILDELSGGADHRPECVIEASNLVAAFIDADGRHSNAELDAWLESIGPRLTPPMIVSTQTLRDDGTFGGRARWLEQPSTMFDLLVKADAKDARRRANRYYTLAMVLAHATAAVDPMPSQAELVALDRFRTLLLRTMDDHGVPRPGRPDAATPAVRAEVGAVGSDEPDGAQAVELAPERRIEELLAELDALVGLDHVKQEVRRLTSLLRIQEMRADRDLPTIETSKHLVFSGNPGTGKTTVARLLSQIFRSLGVVSRGHLVETDRSGLVAGFVGQTATQTRKVMESAIGGTLLIDEAYALARGGDNDFGLEAVDTIVKFMEDHRDDLSVVAAGYPAEMQELIDANPGLKSRFTRTIHFPDYSTDELVAIFSLISSAKEYHLDASGVSRLEEVIDAEPRGRGFGNGRFVRNVFEAAVGHHALRLADIDDLTDEQLTRLTAEDIHPVD
ncbi:AAA family ATPase [Ilumatobacter nonamiensis]|uniref:AAA family ATPase n=1 Tax=Ilumatobacter nonamiensis TaxID=467093 RepID=UPI000345641B|nr:AAA family ATPase [Ilumatobacter nonamiensis]